MANLAVRHVDSELAESTRSAYQQERKRKRGGGGSACVRLRGRLTCEGSAAVSFVLCLLVFREGAVGCPFLRDEFVKFCFWGWSTSEHGIGCACFFLLNRGNFDRGLFSWGASSCLPRLPLRSSFCRSVDILKGSKGSQMESNPWGLGAAVWDLVGAKMKLHVLGIEPKCGEATCKAKLATGSQESVVEK